MLRGSSNYDFKVKLCYRILPRLVYDINHTYYRKTLLSARAVYKLASGSPLARAHATLRVRILLNFTNSLILSAARSVDSSRPSINRLVFSRIQIAKVCFVPPDR